MVQPEKSWVAKWQGTGTSPCPHDRLTGHLWMASVLEYSPDCGRTLGHFQGSAGLTCGVWCGDGGAVTSRPGLYAIWVEGEDTREEDEDEEY